MQAYTVDLPDTELLKQQRNYLVSAQHRTRSQIGQLQARLFSLDNALSQHPGSKRERKRLQQARWKSNKNLQICVSEEQAISSNLRNLDLNMQAQSQTQGHFRPFGSFSSSSNSQWLSSEESWPTNSETTDAGWATYPTTETYEWFTPQWQAQEYTPDALLDATYNTDSLISPVSFQYPYEITTETTYPNFDAAYGPSDQLSTMIVDQAPSDDAEFYLQPVRVPGFESFAWDHPFQGPQQWINPRALSASQHSRVESALISPRTVKRFNVPAPISTVMEIEELDDGSKSASTLRADATPFTPKSFPTSNSPASPNAQTTMHDESNWRINGGGHRRRYSAAVVGLIEYRLRHSNDKGKAQSGQYGQVYSGNMPEDSSKRSARGSTWVAAHKKSYSVPPRFGKSK